MGPGRGRGCWRAGRLRRVVWWWPGCRCRRGRAGRGWAGLRVCAAVRRFRFRLLPGDVLVAEVGQRGGVRGGLGAAGRRRGGELVEEPEQLDRDRHDQRAVFFGGDLDHGLQQPQLQRGGVAGHHVGGRGQPLGGLVLAVGGDDPGAPLPFGLGLPRHRPLHALGQRDILDLHPLDPHPPRALGRLVDDPAQLPVDRVPLRQQLVHLRLADDRPQRRLRLLRHREHVILHVDRRLDRVHHPEIHHRIDPDGHVVLGDAILRRDGHRDDLHVHLLHPVTERPDQRQPRTARPAQHPPEPENDPLLVLLHHLHRPPRRDQPGHREHHQDDHQRHHRHHHLSRRRRGRRPPSAAGPPAPPPTLSTQPETSKIILEIRDDT